MFDFQKTYYILFYSMDHAVKALPKTEENLPSRKLLESALHLVEQEYDRILQYEACKKKQKTKNTWSSALIILIITSVSILVFIAGLFYGSLCLL